jgi:predicted DCC family thiol-disulfide oxidoreductase YuxK
MNPDGRPLLVFDGDCGFCTKSAEWVSRDWRGRARAVPWQTLGEKGLAEIGLTIEQVTESAWWVDQLNQPVGGHRAIGESLRACRGWKRALGTAIVSPPLDWIGPAAYRLVARHRYRLPGGTPACRAADPAPSASESTRT